MCGAAVRVYLAVEGLGAADAEGAQLLGGELYLAVAEAAVDQSSSTDELPQALRAAWCKFDAAITADPAQESAVAGRLEVALLAVRTQVVDHILFPVIVL